MSHSLKQRLCQLLIFCMVLAYIPLGAATPAQAYGNGVLLNGGFESATGSGVTIFDAWKIDSTGSKATNGSPAGSTYARTGNNALKVSSGNGTQKTPGQQFVAVTPGQTYTISYYLNVVTCTSACSTNGSSTGMTIRFYDKVNPDNFSTTGSTQIGSDVFVGGVTGATTSGYTQLTKSFTVPANAKYARIYVTSVSGTSASMIAYVDDVSLEQTAGPAPTAPTGVTLNKSTTTIEKAATETLTATVAPAGAPQAVNWTSSNANIATVDVNSGLVTGVNPGTATITATSTTQSPGSVTNAVYTASAVVTVVAGAPTPEYGLTLTPSFNSISVYIAGGRDDLIRHLYYKKSSDSTWKEALEPINIPGKGIFSGSIVRLDEDTSYDVKSDIYYGSTLLKSESGSVRTWTSTPTIAQTISLSTLYSGSGALTIDGVNGTNSGWVKIVNDTGLTIDAGTTANNAVTVTNSVYAILDGFIVKGGKKNGIYLNNTDHDVRITNADISGWGRVAVDAVHTQQQLNFINKSDVGYGAPIDADGFTLEGDAGFRIEDAKNIVVERSYVHEPNGYANAWTGITPDGQAFSNSHPQGPEAMYLRSGGGMVVRYNDFSGTDEYHRFNDVISGYYNSDESGGFYKDADVYGNFFGYSNDDSVEFDGGQSNIRVYDNRVEMSYAGLSFAPNMVGPSYAFNNVLYNMNDFRRTGTGSVIKLGGNSSTVYKGETWFFNNTIYAVPKAIVGSSTPKNWYGGTRNNIIVVMRNFADLYYNIEDPAPSINPGTNFDYDALGRSTAADGAGQIQANSGAEAHGLFKIGKMTNPAAGVFTPMSTGIDAAKEVNIIDKGTVVKNFSETFSGSAPDIGAFEQGASSLFPKRPIPFQSDKYLVSIPATDNSSTFTISTGALTDSGAYTIRRNAEEDWYTVTPTTGTFASNSSTTFTVTVDRTKASFNRAAEYSTLFIRLTNGFSVPITIKADNTQAPIPFGQTVDVSSTKPFPGTANLNADWKSSSAAAVITSSLQDAASVSVKGAYAGSATLTANSSVNGGNQSEYRVVIPSKLSDLQVNGATVTGFSPDTFTYNVVLPAGAGAPTVTAASQDAATSSPSTVAYTTLPTGATGTAVVTTTSADGTTSNTYTIQFSEQNNSVVASAALSGTDAAAAGQSFELTFGVGSVTNAVYQTVMAEDLTLNYDPAKLELVSVASTKTNFGIVSQTVLAPGQVRIMAAAQGTANAIQVNGDSLKFTFSAKSLSQAASTSVSVGSVVIANQAGQELQVDGGSHTIQIAAAINKTALNQAITDAQTKVSAAVEGTQVGQYVAGAKAQLSSAIDTAQAVVSNNTATQEQVDAAVQALNNAVGTFDELMIIGDLNNDGRISIGDLAVIAGAYGTTSTDTNWNSKADINHDNQVNLLDLVAIAQLIQD